MSNSEESKRVTTHEVAVWEVYDDVYSGAPLATFLCEKWAGEWREQYCRTGLIKVGSRLCYNCTAQEIHKIETIKKAGRL